MTLIFALLLSLARADTQTFGPVTMQIPNEWSCQTEGQNFVCLDNSPDPQKNSAIVIGYKVRGPEDAVGVFRDQLSRPRMLTQGDVTTPSVPKGTRDVNINGTIWIEGIHFASEMSNYYTHYYATVAGTYAVLVSYSVHESIYPQGAKTVQAMVESIHLNVPQTAADVPGLNAAQTSAPKISSLKPEKSSGYTLNTKPPPKLQSGVTLFGRVWPRSLVFMAFGLMISLGLFVFALVYK